MAAGFAAAIPLVIPVIAEVIRSSRSEGAEMEKERLEVEKERMKTTLDEYRRLQEQNEREKAAAVSTYNELMMKREDAHTQREKALNEEITAMRVDFVTRTQEMDHASKEEREQIQAHYRTQIKAKENELRGVQTEAKRERDVERRAFEARQMELIDHERTLLDCLHEQEKHHSEATRLLMEKQGVQVQAMQEKSIEREREHGKIVQDMLRQHLQEERLQQTRQMAFLAAHYQTLEKVGVADQLNHFRTTFSLVESNHENGISHLTTVIEDFQNLNVGIARGSLCALATSLGQLVCSENAVISVLDKASSVPLASRIELKKFFTTMALHRRGYSTRAKHLSGKLSRNPPAEITELDVQELEEHFKKNGVAQLACDSQEMKAKLADIENGITAMKIQLE